MSPPLTGFKGLDGLTFNPDHVPLESRSWSDLRLKPDRRDPSTALDFSWRHARFPYQFFPNH